MSDKTKGGVSAMSLDRQCRATSKQTGERCKRIVPLGHVVCHYHGGASQKSKDRAKLRLLELVEPAVAQVARLMTSAADERVRLRAAENVLDRAGLPRGVKIDGADARSMLVARLEAYRVEAGLPEAGFEPDDEVYEAEGMDDETEGDRA